MKDGKHLILCVDDDADLLDLIQFAAKRDVGRDERFPLFRRERCRGLVFGVDRLDLRPGGVDVARAPQPRVDRDAPSVDGSHGRAHVLGPPGHRRTESPGGHDDTADAQPVEPYACPRVVVP